MARTKSNHTHSFKPPFGREVSSVCETEGACESFNSYRARLHAFSFTLLRRERLACGLGHARGKTIINRFLTPSRHFVTSRREPFGVREASVIG